MNKKVCFYCKENDDKVPKLFQKDHIFGRNISKETVRACLNCHAKKTYYQNKFPPSVRKKSANKIAKCLYGLTSADSTLIVILEKRIKIAQDFVKEMKRRGLIE